MGRSTLALALARAATVLGACAVVAAGAAASGAKTAAKGKPTGGYTYVGNTHTANGKTYAAGLGHDRLLGPGAVTLTFSKETPTSQPGVVKATAKPMVIWMRQGVLSGGGTVLLNTSTGALTAGHASFTGVAGALTGHTLVVTFHGTANLAKGQYFYRYSGTFR